MHGTFLRFDSRTPFGLQVTPGLQIGNHAGRFAVGHCGHERLAVKRLVRATGPFINRGHGGRALGNPGGGCGENRRARVCLAAWTRDPGVLVLVFRLAGRAAGLLDLGTNHRDDSMVRQAALARAVIIQDVTEPKLPLLHLQAPDGRTGGERDCERPRHTSRAGF
jgi:hypothetical protein